MRKIISLGLLVLSMGFFSSSCFAVNVEDCDVLKADGVTKGLYGLCIAWHNAGSEDARRRIGDMYDEKRDESAGDPPLPGSGTPECPCWDTALLAAASATDSPLYCENGNMNEGDWAVAYDDFVNYFFDFSLTGTSCSRQVDAAEMSVNSLLPAQVEICRAGLDVLIADDFSGTCP